MRRIGLGVVLALSLLLGPLSAGAQQAGQVHRVGLIFTTSPVSEMTGSEPVHPSARAFVQGLRALGWVEGQNFILERRSAEGQFERFGAIVAELVRLKTDVIVAPGDLIPRAAMAISTTVPIVLMLVVGPEIEGKRLEIFREALPGVSRVAYLGSKEEKDWEGPWGQSVRTAAQALGVTLVLAEFPSRQYADAFAHVTRARAEAVFVSPSLLAFADRALVVELATRARVPTMFAYRQQVELGGLMSYGVNVVDNFRRAASFVDRILKGAKPADLPVEQPTKFELVINLKAAKALGLTIPQSLLLRADQVIE